MGDITASHVIFHVVFVCLTRLPVYWLLATLCKIPTHVRFTAIMLYVSSDEHLLVISLAIPEIV
jgi:hypothetical protein